MGHHGVESTLSFLSNIILTQPAMETSFLFLNLPARYQVSTLLPDDCTSLSLSCLTQALLLSQ